MDKILKKKINFRGKIYDISLRPDADESVLAEIFDWREYKAVENIIMKYDFPVLDAGAHIGLFSLYVKAFNSVVRIYALEPEEENFMLLQKNLTANRLRDIRVFKAALAGKTGSGELALETDSINHHLTDGDRKNDGVKITKVRTYSLEDFMATINIPCLGLLKMDIEGGEYEVLENISLEGFEKIHNIILEYHEHSGHNHKELENILRRNGFSVQIFPSRFEKGLGFMFARNKRAKRQTIISGQ